MRRRSAITVVESLVVMSFIGIMMALALPAIQQARESGRRVECQNHLRQIGVALLEFHTIHNTFPPGQDEFGLLDHSWATAVLPQLELEDLYARYDFDYAWDYPSPTVHNLEVARTDLS